MGSSPPGFVRCWVAALVAAGLAAATAPVASAATAEVHDYDLGRIDMPTPGPRGPIPVRLWGTIGMPVGPGPHPLVLVLHGRHGDNCPVGPGDAEVWPCFGRERRNDLGLRHVVRALAARGLVALAPDLNAAFTAGWGEPDDVRRWPRIVNRVLARVAREARRGGGDFGVDLQGRVRLDRIGLLGHSISGHRAVRFARGPHGASVRALFLLAPVFGRVALPDLPAAVVLGSCDGDTGTRGRRYLELARRATGRRRRVFLARLPGANHNYYNRTLARLGHDDAPRRCRRRGRLRPRVQQRWLERAAADFFAATLRREPRPAWLRPGAPLPRRVYGLRVRVRRG